MPQRLSAAATEFTLLPYSQVLPYIAGKQQQQPPELEREEPAARHQPQPPGLDCEWDDPSDVQHAAHYDPSDGGCQPQQLMWNPEDARHVEDWQQQVHLKPWTTQRFPN